MARTNAIERRRLEVMNALWITTLCLMLAASVTAADVGGPDGSLDMFCVIGGSTDIGCCETTTLFLPQVPLGQVQFTLAVQLHGATSQGISGAEFYLDTFENLPADWTASWTGAAGTTTVGDPFAPHNPGDGSTARRCNVLFSVSGPLPEDGCKTGNRDLVEIGTVTLSTQSATEDLPRMYASVIRSDPPGAPDFDCVLVTLCDSPAYTKVCVTGGAFVINNSMDPPHTPFPSDGDVGVPHAGTTMSWEWPYFVSCIIGGFYQSLAFGATSPPPPVEYDYQHSTFDPGVLEPFTTYYWRVVRSWGGLYSATSPIWSFTTGDLLPIEQTTWSSIKRLYR